MNDWSLLQNKAKLVFRNEWTRSLKMSGLVLRGRQDTPILHQIHLLPECIVPALAGFQSVSPQLDFPHVSHNNNNNHENHSAPMQKAADLDVPGEF